MKIISNCTKLARLLSTNFLSSERYNETTSSIQEYLSSNGILLTMCMGNFCAIGNNPFGGDDYIATSYINNNIGFRIVTTPDTNIGYVLNPNQTNVLCLYPTDGGTLGRSNSGCGPSYSDPIYGDSGYKRGNFISRYYRKKAIQKYTQLNFGKNKNPIDIPCDHFYQPLGHKPPIVWELSSTSSSASSTTTHRSSRYLRNANEKNSSTKKSTTTPIISNLSYATVPGKSASWDAPFLNGNPPCDIRNEAPTFHYNNSHIGDHWWLYLDHISWNVSDFQYVIDSMNLFVVKDPKIDLWNEIVISLPSSSSMSQLVLAVFFIIYPNTDQSYINRMYQKALIETKLLATNEQPSPPLLIVNLTALEYTEPLFQCAEDIM